MLFEHKGYIEAGFFYRQQNLLESLLDSQPPDHYSFFVALKKYKTLVKVRVYKCLKAISSSRAIGRHEPVDYVLGLATIIIFNRTSIFIFFARFLLNC